MSYHGNSEDENNNLMRAKGTAKGRRRQGHGNSTDRMLTCQGMGALLQCQHSGSCGRRMAETEASLHCTARPCLRKKTKLMCTHTPYICVCVCIYIYVCVCVCVYVYVCVCMYVCVYIYIYLDMKQLFSFIVFAHFKSVL